MQEQEDTDIIFKPIYKVLILICIAFIVLGALAIYFYGPNQSQVEITEVDSELIRDGIHVRTGLVEAGGLQTVITNCTTCHSSKLIIQNRMGVEQWNSTIRWMQKTQGLWELGANQKVIVNYLVKNYPPLEKGRRQALTNIDWYRLNE
ncbi:monoheme cytochrome C [Maribacter sp. ACAM166]|uniref:monoheme cytochrome C n=1 Tax=Maribacter sp. ACAM166 TaxID=2508996 RepID=UPI0010FE26E1|nr:monoheme cytochrome C [Maribacter sp. ACAM166]TLP79631.1 monoheme cytochrome C [Maribacter sp. ACAM166]